MTPTLRITSPFGIRVHPITGERRHHNGLDLALPQGTPIRPLAPGRVVRIYLDDPLNGTAARVDHGGGWGSSYVHLSALYVQPGDLVDPSRPLGLSGGAPGSWGAGRSTGPHLHLVVWFNGQAVDPLPLVTWRPFVLET